MIACGDDVAQDAGSDVVEADAPVADVREDVPADASPGDSSTADVVTDTLGDVTDVTDIADAADGMPDSGPSDPTVVVARLSQSESQLREDECACDVERGEYESVEACVADNPIPFATEEQIECAQTLLDAEPEEAVIFGCQVDAREELTRCLGALDCDGRMVDAEGGSACLRATQQAFVACGVPDGEIANAIQECSR